MRTRVSWPGTTRWFWKARPPKSPGRRCTFPKINSAAVTCASTNPPSRAQVEVSREVLEVPQKPYAVMVVSVVTPVCTKGIEARPRPREQPTRTADLGLKIARTWRSKRPDARPPNTRSLSPSAALDVAPGSGMLPPGANSKCGDGRTSTRSRAASAGTTCATCVDPAVAVAKGPNAPHPRWSAGRPALARPITGAPPTGPFRGRTHRRSRVHRGLGRSRRRGRLRTALRRGREGSRRRRRSSGAAA